MMKNEAFLVDVDLIARKVSGGRKVPRFVLGIIKRVIHQEDFNRYFREGTLGTEFLEGFLKYIDVTVNVTGIENVPEDGLFTFVSNHPLGILETCAECAVLCRRYDGRIAVPANDLMMSVRQVREIMIPVNKMGGQGRELAAALDEAFASDKQMLYFPAGMCARKIKGKITEMPWKKTFVTKSRQYHRDIIPVWFSGQNSKRFYFIASLCKFLKLKLNLAMFTLPSELFKCRGKHFEMVIGKPIPWQSLDHKLRSDSEWAEYLREQTLSLKKD